VHLTKIRRAYRQFHIFDQTESIVMQLLLFVIDNNTTANAFITVNGNGTS